MESATLSKLNTRKRKSQTHPPLTLKNKPSMVDTLMAALEHREVTGRRHYVHVSDVLPKHAPPHGPPHHPQHQPRSRFFSTFLSFCCKNSLKADDHHTSAVVSPTHGRRCTSPALFLFYSYLSLLLFANFAQLRVVAVHHDAFYPY